MRAQIGPFTLCGDGLCVGYDSADPVSRSYPPNYPFTGGRIIGVGVDIGEDQYLDLEKLAAAAFAGYGLATQGWMIYAIIAVGLDLAWGYGGMLALGQGVFFGLGAYVAGWLALAGWSEPISCALAGGVSAAPWDSLNLGLAVGDDPDAVAENRRRFVHQLGARPVWLRQVHGTTVLRATAALAKAVASHKANKPPLK